VIEIEDVMNGKCRTLRRDEKCKQKPETLAKPKSSIYERMDWIGYIWLRI
jgi:hypothetical protein